MEYRHILVEDVGEEVVVYCTCKEMVGDLVVEEVARELFDVCEIAGTKSQGAMVLDLTGVRSMSSLILGKLITLKKRLRERGMAFRMRNMSPEMADMFTLTNIAKLFSIEQNAGREDATHFAGELFGARLDVLERLEKAGFRWMSDFRSVDPRHDVYGIEVRGIATEDDARAIRALLIDMFPSWRSRRGIFTECCETGWRVEVFRGNGPAIWGGDG